MYYLVNKYADVDRRIVTEKHNIVQAHLKEADEGWDAERIITWLWGIDKKSENVFDLLEVGDVVRYDIHFIEVDDNNRDVLDEQYISKIYKPNYKGGYDLAWERDE